MLVNLKSWVIFLVWYSLNGYARSCGWLDRCVNLEEIAFPFFFLIGTWTEFENGKTNGRLYWAWTGSVENIFARFFFVFIFFFWAVVNEIFRNTVHANPKSGFFDLPISHASPKSGIFFGLPGWETFVQQHATVYMDHNFILIHLALWATALKKGFGSLKLEYSVNLRKNQPCKPKKWDVCSSTP